MADETPGWHPMSREEFGELERGQLVQDRRGRVWTITAEPFERNLELHVVVRSGDLVREIPERYADEYMPVPA